MTNNTEADATTSSSSSTSAAAAPASLPSSSNTSPVTEQSSLSTTPTTAPATNCHTPGCGKPASLKCPACISMSLPVALFCSQDCFKGSWKVHNEVHKQERARREFIPPSFDYRGPLRPHFTPPMRTVPDLIRKPDYATTGVPLEEQQARMTRTIQIYSVAEIAGIRAACQIGREALDLAHSMIRVGVTTEAIDLAVHEFIVSKDAYPSPLNYLTFPKSCCTSVNEIICHGIPDTRPLQDGDIVNVDVSVYYNGYHADLNETYPVGTVAEDSLKLIRYAHDSMMAAINTARPGTMCRDFGDVITKYVSKMGYGVVRSYCGHGIGKLFHSAPDIPHYAKNKAVGVLKPGMIFTIEPMLNMGDWRDVTWPDQWSISTADGKRSAQFEHTILVTEMGPEILTARTEKSPKFFWETK